MCPRPSRKTLEQRVGRGVRCVLPVVAVIVGSSSVPAYAQVGGGGRPTIGPSSTAQLSYSGGIAANGAAESQEASTSQRFHDFAATARLFRTKQTDWTVRAGVSTLNLGGDLTLTRPGAPLPGRFWDIGVQSSFRHTAASGWTWGVMAGAGSRSDRPFDSFDELTLEATATLSIPNSRTGMYMVFVNYSNNRGFLNNVPIPGVAYLWMPARNFTATIGVPFASMTWRPTEETSLRVSYFPITNVDARATASITKALEVHVGFAWTNDGYLRAGREDPDERVFLNKRRFDLGFALRLAEALVVDVDAGVEVGRFLYEGEDYLDRHQSRIDLEDVPDVRVGLRWDWN